VFYLPVTMPTSKPTNIDAQRILAIMDELKEKLTFLSVVTSQVQEGLQSEEGQLTQELLGPDLVKAIAEQIRLEELYIVANPSTPFGTGDDSEDARDDVKLLKKNTLELCRKMKAVPHIVSELRKLQERPQAVIAFLKTLADMQDLTLKRLTTTVEEENSRQELLEHYKAKLEEANKKRAQLEKDLTFLHQETEAAQQNRSQILLKLKAQLQDVKDKKLSDMKELHNRYETRMKGYQNDFNARRQSLEHHIESLKGSNEKLRNESEDNEKGQKKQCKREEKNVYDLIEKYDKEVREFAQQQNEQEDGFKRERKRLTELKEHFAKVEQERECILQETGLQESRRAKMEAEKARRDDASSLVQAFWKGIIQREQYASMKRSKKKGGKKGKKGK